MLHLRFHSISLHSSVAVFLSSQPPRSHSSSSLFDSLFLSLPALHLTHRENCSHNIALPLGPACDLLPTQSSLPRPHQLGEAEVDFASTSRFLRKDTHWHIFKQKHTQRRAKGDEWMFSGQPAWPLSWPRRVTTLWCMCHFFSDSDLGAHTSVTEQTKHMREFFSDCFTSLNTAVVILSFRFTFGLMITGLAANNIIFLLIWGFLKCEKSKLLTLFTYICNILSH